MRRARTMTLGLLAACALGVAPAAQQEAKVSAQLSTGVARLGEEVGIKIVLENSRNARIVEVPSVEGLTLGRPSGPGVYEFRGEICVGGDCIARTVSFEILR